MDQLEPPQVIVPLQSIQLTEGSPALLQAKIVGRPTPDVSSYLHGHPFYHTNMISIFSSL
jgi:hypothetical protein